MMVCMRVPEGPLTWSKPGSRMASVSVTPMPSSVCRNRQLDQSLVRLSPFVPLRFSFVLMIIAHLSATSFRVEGHAKRLSSGSAGGNAQPAPDEASCEKRYPAITCNELFGGCDNRAARWTQSMQSQAHRSLFASRPAVSPRAFARGSMQRKSTRSRH
jgi:hypothetical protein